MILIFHPFHCICLMIDLLDPLKITNIKFMYIQFYSTFHGLQSEWTEVSSTADLQGRYYNQAIFHLAKFSSTTCISTLKLSITQALPTLREQGWLLRLLYNSKGVCLLESLDTWNSKKFSKQNPTEKLFRVHQDWMEREQHLIRNVYTLLERPCKAESASNLEGHQILNLSQNEI